MGRRVLWETVLAVAALTLAVAVALAAGLALSYTPNARTFTRLLAGQVIGGALLFACLFTALVAVGRLDAREGRRVSTLYRPIVLLTACLAAYFGITAINAIDLLAHDTPRWRLAREPEIRIVVNALILGVVGGSAWFLWHLLRDRGVSPARVVALYAAIAAVIGTVITAAVLWGDRV